MQGSDELEISEYMDNEIRIYRFAELKIGIPFILLVIPSPTTIDPAWRNETVFVSIIAALFLAAIAWGDLNLFPKSGKIYEDHLENLDRNYLVVILSIIFIKVTLFVTEIHLSEVYDKAILFAWIVTPIVILSWAYYVLRTQSRIISRFKELKELCEM